ncbi:MAG: hypothetical protein ACRELB_10795 [Polyangiaceae bacterium]
MAELTSAWWSRNKAKTLKSTGLGDALRHYEEALAEVKRLATSPIVHTTLERFNAVQEMLSRALPHAVDTATAACNRTLHKDTIAALKEYKEKLIPKEATHLVNLRETYAKRYDALKKEFAASCQELFELSGKTLDVARAALDKAKSLVGGSDAATMEMMDDLAKGPAGKADAERRMKRIQTSVVEIGTLRTVAQQALLKARAERKEKFTYKPGVIAPGEDNWSRMGDKIQGNLDAVEMTIEQVGEQTRIAQEAAAEAETLLKGNTDNMSGIYKKSATRAADTAMHLCDRLEGATRPLGGDIDGLNFRFLNASEKREKDGDQAAFREELKLVSLGIAAKDKTCADIVQGCTAALAEIEKLEKGFPEFVKSDRDNFGREFETMRKSIDGLEEAKEEATAARAKLRKLLDKVRAAFGGGG